MKIMIISIIVAVMISLGHEKVPCGPNPDVPGCIVPDPPERPPPSILVFKG